MTAHYSVAQVKEIYDTLERITSESHRQNRTLAMIAREARAPEGTKVPEKSPVGRSAG